MTGGGFLGDEVPNREPNGVATHETLVPGKTVEGGVESNEDGVREGGEEGVGETGDGVGLVDDNVGASELGSEAGGERDVAASADENVGLEASEVAEALEKGVEETVREEERVGVGRCGDRGEVVAGGGDCGAFHAVGGAEEEKLGRGVQGFELLRDCHRRVDVAACAAAGEGHTERVVGGR